MAYLSTTLRTISLLRDSPLCILPDTPSSLLAQVCMRVSVYCQLPFICGSGTDLMSLLILFFFLLGRPHQKNLRLRRFESDRDEIWQECSSCSYASIYEVRFSIWSHTFKITAMPSCYAEKCCHLVNAHRAFVRRIYAAASDSSWPIVHSYLFFRQLGLYTCKQW